MDDQLSTTELSSDAEPVVETGAETSANDAPSIDNSLDAIWQKNNVGEETDQIEIVAPTEEVSTDQPQQGAQEPELPAIDAPNAWSADMKGKWADVSPDIQAYIAERETDAHAQITRMGQEIAEARPVRELLDQNLDLFDAAGVGATDGLSQLFKAQRLLNENPLQGLATIAQTFGVDLTQAFGPQNGQVDPQMGQLQSEVTQLKNQLQQRDNSTRMAEERDQKVRRREEQAKIEAWGEDKPYFSNNAVRSMMGALVGNGQAQSLDDAYEMACHAVPQVRAELAKQVKAEEEAAAKRAQEEAVRDAKKAQKANLGKNNSGAPAIGKSANDDAYLGRLYDRVNGS